MNLGITPNFTIKKHAQKTSYKKDVSFGETYCMVLPKSQSIGNRALLLTKGFLAESSQKLQVVFNRGFFSNQIYLIKGSNAELLAKAPAPKQKQIFKQILSEPLSVIKPKEDSDIVDFIKNNVLKSNL